MRCYPAPRLPASLAGMVILWVSVLTPSVGYGDEWSIPTAGNAFPSEPASVEGRFLRGGELAVSPNAASFIYFHVDRPAELELSVTARTDSSPKLLVFELNGRQHEVQIESNRPKRYAIGRASIDKAGYAQLKVSAKGESKASGTWLESLHASSSTEDLRLTFVESNQDNMFYWGRRGPSVHLRYEVPRDPALQYAYTELTVPEGMDPIGSYFMANGFGEGYFGIQVNGPEERRVLFSVWSPFKTDDPSEIPADQRITTLASGKDVVIKEFGNEGSGGQSFLVYPWRAGKTYRFLTEVRPDGEGATIYTSWFGDKTQKTWHLIASFRRPQTQTHLRGFHSFLESFDPHRGHLPRKVFYGNVWVRDVTGTWHRCDKARLSVDATGGGGHRLDFGGGATDSRFFLQNCGFRVWDGKPGATYRRDASNSRPPEIEWDALPGG